MTIDKGYKGVINVFSEGLNLKEKPVGCYVFTSQVLYFVAGT